MDYQQKEISISLEITYSLRYLSCENPLCITCQIDQKHGPYWYALLDLNGVQKSIYIGKKFKPLNISRIEIEDNKKEEATTKVVGIISAAEINKDEVQEAETISIAKIRLPTQEDFENDILILRRSIEKKY